MQAASQRPLPHGRPLRIGILGAGQLAFLLCRAAPRLGLRTVVAAQDASEPATRAADEVLLGQFEDPAFATQLVDATDIVTFDKEAIPAAMLQRLEAAERAGHIQVRPGTTTLRLLQNKARQKTWLQAQGLPTLPFLTLDGDPRDWADRVAALEFPCVQKTQHGGYDGKGVQVLRSADELSALWPAPSLIEPCLDEMTELAVLVARGVNGETRCYPPVTMEFAPELNVLSTVTSPAQVPAAMAREAQAIAERVVEALEGIGLFCIEMFLTPDGSLLINEVSPRVHNAGHHTLEANATSQFEQHLRAIAGLPLGPVRAVSAAVMQNLLHTPGLERLQGLGPGKLPHREVGVHAWWYGKSELRAWRKVGHVTVLGNGIAAARNKLARAMDDLTPSEANAA